MPHNDTNEPGLAEVLIGTIRRIDNQLAEQENRIILLEEAVQELGTRHGLTTEEG